MSMQKYNDLVARAENAEMQLEDASRHVLRLQTRAESAEMRLEEARFLLAEAAMAEAAEIQCAETARMSLTDLETRALSWSSAAQAFSKDHIPRKFEGLGFVQYQPDLYFVAESTKASALAPR